MSGGGCDWLTVRYFVLWSNYDDLAQRLNAAKADAAERGDDATAGLLKFGETVVRVGPTRAGRGFAACEWWFQVDGIMIAIRKGSEPQGELGNLCVTISGVPLLARGRQWCTTRAVQMIEEMGGRVIGNRVSRYDAAADLAGVSMASVAQAFNSGYVVRRSNDLFCRIYDKLAEAKRDPDKLHLMANKRWGGKVPASAIRVEFQLNREALAKHGIDTLEDLDRHEAALVKYLVSEWLRFTADKPKRWAERAAPLAGWWRTVQSAFAAWCGKADPKPSALPKRGKVQHIKQAFGCLAAYFAGRGFCPDQKVDAALAVVNLFREYRDMFFEKLEQKNAALNQNLDRFERRYEDAETNFSPGSPMNWSGIPV
jgi:hypothetical protein